MPWTNQPALINKNSLSVKHFIYLAFVLLAPAIGLAQRPVYTISATLDTTQHLLKGDVEIMYTNNASSPLDRLAIHLWPNAFASKNTAFAHQMLNLDKLTFDRAKNNDLGGFTDLNFTSPDHPLTFESTADPDIAWLILSTPLQPGKSITIKTPYTEKIPISFSRPGRTDMSYQFTQWYPHIAVYDEQGWHTMPYLDSGEYFNDFADYDVTIVVPDGYVIAATGTGTSNDIDGPNTEWKFTATNVIDFAWFASPEFTHEKKVIEVDQQSVELNIYIDPYLTEHWDSAIFYAERAMHFYSDWVGPYPYPQMSVVYAPFSRGGYMEYPMIAQIGTASSADFLDRVIAHEIGHTWLYAILASDEREHPWIDEGFNTFLENQYMRAYYADPREVAFPSIVDHKDAMDHYDVTLHNLKTKRQLQPPETHPEDQLNNQYLLSAYILPAKGLEIMRLQVGDEMMKRMYRRVFKENQLSLVSPEDFKTSFEAECQFDLSWFFEEWVHHSDQIDYRIKNFNAKADSVVIQNKSPYAHALTVSGYKDHEHVETKWLQGFTDIRSVSFNKDIDEVRLYDHLSANKYWQRDVRPKQFPAFHIVPKVGSYSRSSISTTPIFGYNLTDGIMPGIAIMTDVFPQPRLKLLLMPFFGLESKSFRYHGEIRYNSDIDFLSFDKVLMGISASEFGYNVDTHYLFRDDYARLSPSIAFRFHEKNINSHNTKWLKYRYVNITQNYGIGENFLEYVFRHEDRSYGIHELSYQMRSDFVLRPYFATAAVQTGEGFVRVNLQYQQHFRGRDKMRGIWVRGFAGWLPYLDEPKANVLFFFNGISSNGYSSKDYMYDEWLIGRNAVNGNFTRQVFIKDAGLKTFATNGLSEKWMMGGGISVSMPIKYLHLYMDAALYPSGITQEAELSYTGGIAVVLMKDVFEIYLPLLESKDIRESLPYQINKLWHQRITFQANFKLANPFYLVDEYHLQYR
ncbi:MAG: M1 family metallopeptidase [Bacteroidota bacterium]|nr:M1 family metallopeptidase [Bacteroidota bacterium]